MKYVHGVDKNAYIIPEETIEKHMEFEKKVMNFILDGNGEVFDVLREQYSNSRVVKREFTGVGFFTEFEIEPNIKKIMNLDGPVFSINAFHKHTQKRHANFMLWIEDGRLNTLEGVTIYEWDYDYDNYILKHGK